MAEYLLYANIIFDLLFIFYQLYRVYNHALHV